MRTIVSLKHGGIIEGSSVNMTKQSVSIIVPFEWCEMPGAILKKGFECGWSVFTLSNSFQVIVNRDEVESVDALDDILIEERFMELINSGGTWIHITKVHAFTDICQKKGLILHGGEISDNGEWKYMYIDKE